MPHHSRNPPWTYNDDKAMLNKFSALKGGVDRLSRKRTTEDSGSGEYHVRDRFSSSVLLSRTVTNGSHLSANSRCEAPFSFSEALSYDA